MSKTRGIVNSINRRIRREEEQDKIIKKEYDKLKVYVDKYEEERYKTEAQKQHERHRRNQKRKSAAMQLEVKPARKYVAKPGTYFYGPLRKLAADFKTLNEISNYMTVGQLMKYEEKGGKLYNLKTGKVAYDPSTGECFE